MNKKGFTLVELLGILVILSLVIILVFNEFSKQIKVAREDAYQRQVKTIISAAKDYQLSNQSDIGVPVVRLNNAGLITMKNLKDPRDKSLMNGCVMFDKNDYGQVEYNYINSFEECFSKNNGEIFHIKNLVTNGSFENDLIGWSSSTNVARSTNYKKFGEYSIRNHGSAQWGSSFTNSDYYYEVIQGHIYYASTYLYIVSGNTSNNCYVDLSIRYDDTDHWSGFASGYGKTLNTWHRLGKIQNIPNVIRPKIKFAIADYNGTDMTQDCYADGVMLVDLTETFGSGNEPTVEWCNNNIVYTE